MDFKFENRADGVDLICGRIYDEWQAYEAMRFNVWSVICIASGSVVTCLLLQKVS